MIDWALAERWTPIVVAALALLVSILAVVPAFIAIKRSRVPKPSWKVVWTHNGHSTPGKTWWRCEVQQHGPGEAERVVVATRIHAKGQGVPVWRTWAPFRPPADIEPERGARPIAHPDQFEEWEYGYLFARGRYAWHEQGTTNNGHPFKVEVRVQWSELPNTVARPELIESHLFPVTLVFETPKAV